VTLPFVIQLITPSLSPLPSPSTLPSLLPSPVFLPPSPPLRPRYARSPSHGFDYPEQREVDKYYPQFYHRQDKEGRPIYIEQLGKLDINKLYALTTQERQLKHLVHEYEKFEKDRLPACSEQKGELVETSCTILDLHNAGISAFYRGGWEAAGCLIGS
jgi:hypothetical protein